MTEAARNLSPVELDALTAPLNARVPRDASAMAAPSRRVLDISTRRPLGLAPIIEPGDDEPEDEEPDEGMSAARSAEMVAWRDAHGGNRGAFLSDIDILIERALKQDRKRTLNIFGQVIGEVIGEMGNEMRREFEGKLAGGADLRGEIEGPQGRASHRACRATARPHRGAL